MPRVHAIDLPEEALLRRYVKEGFYTDCYRADIPYRVSHAQYIEAFYTTKLFKLERLMLKLIIARPSTDGQAQALASGTRDTFAAWSVEDREPNQLLMCDVQGRTRSWLMTVQDESTNKHSTILYFGSAVVPARNKKTGKEELGLVFSALLGFHRWYSIALLSAATRRLAQTL